MMTEQGGYQLRRLSAAKLLAIHRKVMAMESADELERSLVGNAMGLAAVCERDGRPAFEDGQAVLDRLTAPEMESLLRRAAERQQGGEESVQQDGATSAQFDEERFLRMKEGG